MEVLEMLEELLPIFINQCGLDVTFKEDNTQAAPLFSILHHMPSASRLRVMYYKQSLMYE